MKKVIIFLCASLPLAGFAVDANIVSKESITCNVRLSNAVIPSTVDSDSDFSFCTGTIVGDNLLVTSAHCVNQTGSLRVSNLSDIPAHLKFNIAVGGRDNSKSYEVVSGSSGAVYDEAMATAHQREDYLSRHPLSLIKDDLVILRLSSPVAGVDTSICPQLPTAAECAELAAFISAPDRSLSQITSSFYISDYYVIGDRASRQRLPYPSPRFANVQASYFTRDAQDGFLAAEFNVPPVKVSIHQGDSGTGLLWKKSSTRKLLLGTQSAASQTFAGRALFSDICRFTGHRNWPVQ